MRSLVAPLLLLGACQVDWEESEIDGLRHLTAVGRPSAKGRLPLTVDVLDGETSLLLTLDPPGDATVYVQTVTGPGGDVVFDATALWDSPYTVTNAAFQATVGNLSWPVLDEHPPLEAGRYRVDAWVNGSDEDLPLALSLAADDDPTVGRLDVEVVIPAALSDDDELLRGTMAAIAHWRDEIYAPAGLELTTTLVTWDGPAQLQSPNTGSEEAYAEISGGRALRAVSLVVVDALLDGGNVLGVSGGIPGALVSTGRSAVAVSALEASGADRVFTRVEEHLFGETMAHEVGHYLGLYHPVELPQTTRRPDTWDSLEDTPECQSLEACGEQLADNLMFPTPVCNELDLLGCVDFVAQTVLTPQQTRLAHRYPGVR